MAEGTPEEAMKRVGDAIMSGDYMTAMAEATPDALMQAMSLGGGMMNMPTPESYDIASTGVADGVYSYRITFKAGDQSLSASVTWADVEGAWKITGIGDVAVV